MEPRHPQSTSKVLLNRAMYSVLYDNEKNSPTWVAEYQEVDSEAVSRDGFSFSDDPDIVGEAQKDDYTNSGYDRGHMAPAEDMEISEAAMKECFYMTNMAPQKHSLNGGKWTTMEELARKVAVKEGETWIFSGPIYRTPKPEIFEQAFNALVSKAKQLSGNAGRRFRLPLRVIDASTIELCLSRFLQTCAAPIQASREPRHFSSEKKLFCQLFRTNSQGRRFVPKFHHLRYQCRV